MSRCVYILQFAQGNYSDGVLVKVGLTSDLTQRLKHHRTSFPGWDLFLALPAEFPADVESWLKRLWSPFAWNGSDEVFLIPWREHWFASFLGPAFVESYFSLNHDAVSFRALRVEQRLALIIEASDLALECVNVSLNWRPANSCKVIPASRSRCSPATKKAS